MSENRIFIKQDIDDPAMVKITSKNNFGEFAWAILHEDFLEFLSEDQAKRFSQGEMLEIEIKAL